MSSRKSWKKIPEDVPRKDHPLYQVWTHMRYRCNTPTSPDYQAYGGRGIKVCEEWESFTNFIRWALDSGYEQGLELDRVDNDKGYCPENCRFVTRVVNQNNRRNTPLYEYDGEMMSARELYDMFVVRDMFTPAVEFILFARRLRRGWTPHAAAFRARRLTKGEKDGTITVNNVL